MKNMLFDDDLGTRQTLDDLALVAEDFQRRGLEANTSRTAGTGLSAMQLKQIGTAGAGGYGLSAGALPQMAVGAGLTYATVKGLLSETLARWAAGRTPTVKGTVAPRVPGAVARGLTDEVEDREQE